MPLVIFEGPEAAGKSTIIDALMEAWGPNSELRSWGPQESWLLYCGPLFDDLQVCKKDPQHLRVWSRSWISRAVYNKLLHQGQSVPSQATMELDKIVIASGGLLLMVESPSATLAERRAARQLDPGAKPDHPISPARELNEFFMAIQRRKWKVIPGTIPPEDNVRTIISMLVAHNPECRMTACGASWTEAPQAEEESIDDLVLTSR